MSTKANETPNPEGGELEGEENPAANKYGWGIESIRREDEELDTLLDQENPQNPSTNSEEDADKKTVEKLLHWEFPPNVITRIMKEYRNCGDGEVSSLYSEVFTRFQSSEKKVISDRVNVETFKPGSERKRKLKKRVEQKAFSDNKISWSDDCDTMFVTFTSKTVLSPDNTIEKGETYELPHGLAEELIDRGMARKFVWECPRCKETAPKEEHYSPNPPPICPSPNCDKKKLEALHPEEHHEFAEVFMKNYSFATIAESRDENKPGDIYIYAGGVYKPERAKSHIRSKIRDFNPQVRKSLQKHVVDFISDKSAEPEERFGGPAGKTLVENGVLALETLELIDPDPDLIFTSKIPVKFDRDADCDKFLAYLERMVPDKKDRKRLQELGGTALSPEKPHKKGIMIVGPTDAGKSTLIKILRYVFGEDNVASQSPSRLADTRWGTARLFGKLLNMTDEVSAGRLEKLSMLKRIMDGNPVEAEQKREKVFEFRPTCEHIYAANQTPSASRRDDAFWNRWIVIETPEPVPKDKQNPDLPEEIVEEEAEGILNWLAKGYRDFVENGKKFTYPVDWEESRDKWLKYGDSVEQFIQRCIERDENGEISAEELHELHTEFAERRELDTVSQHELTQRVKKEVTSANYSSSGHGPSGALSGFRGIRVSLPDEKGEGREEVSSVQQFIRECVEREDGEKISSEELYRLYSRFAGKRDLGIEGRKQLSSKIKQLGYVEYSNSYRFEGDKKRGFKNLKVTIPKPSSKLEEPSSELEEVSPDSSSKPQSGRGGRAEEVKNRGNRENDDGDYRKVRGKPTTSSIEKHQKEEGSLTECGQKSSNSPVVTVSTRVQEDKVNALRDIIRGLQDEHKMGALLSVIKREAEAVGVSPESVDEFVERETTEGRLTKNEKEGRVFVELTERNRPDVSEREGR